MRLRRVLLWRLWLGNAVQYVDMWLHDIGMPGRWWCNAADTLFWRIWGITEDTDG